MKIETEFSVGDKVWDDLTGKEAEIIGISFSNGYTEGNKYRCAMETVGYWLDNDYLSGGRHPWEISKLGTKNDK